MKTAKKAPKSYWDMTQEELAEATREFDRELVRDLFRSLGPEKRVIWERLRKQERKRRRKANGRPLRRVRSRDDVRSLRKKVEQAATSLARRIRSVKARPPLDVIKALKLEPLGFDPYDSGRPMNLVEQINQSATLLVACAAVERLLRKHPSREGYVISRPTSKGYDLWAVDVSVAAEVFAATFPGSNDKIEKDLIAILKNKEPFDDRHPPQHRYVFFVSRSPKGFPPRSFDLHGPEHDSVLGEVWHLMDHGRRSVTVVALPEAAVFPAK